MSQPLQPPPICLRVRALLAAPALLLLAGCDVVGFAREEPGAVFSVILVLVLAIGGLVQAMHEPAFPRSTRRRRRTRSGDGAFFDDWPKDHSFLRHPHTHHHTTPIFSEVSRVEECDSSGSSDSSCDSSSD